MSAPRRARKVKADSYLPAEIAAEVRREAQRLGRPVSWLLTHACKLALPTLRQLPGSGPDPDPAPKPRRES